jgi:hypothetical protein
MAHQIKKLMYDTSTSKLKGVVIADETYLGMKVTNMHKDKEVGLVLNVKPKTGILGIMEQHGRIFTQIIDESTQFQNIPETVKEKVKTRSTLVTDGAAHYGLMSQHVRKHVVVNHQNDEYVKDGFSTNTIENYWSTFKRMIKGTHIHVSREHLPKYLAENSFRYVHRHEQAEMFDLILKNAFSRA